MQVAIAYLRGHPAAATDTGLPCPSTTLQYPGDAGIVDVDFCPESGSGAPTGNALAGLLTLGSNKKETDITTGGPGDLVVNGDTFSTTGVSAAGGSRLVVHQGNVWARKACAGTIIVDTGFAAPSCNYAGRDAGNGGRPRVCGRDLEQAAERRRIMCGRRRHPRTGDMVAQAIPESGRLVFDRVAAAGRLLCELR